MLHSLEEFVDERIARSDFLAKGDRKDAKLRKGCHYLWRGESPVATGSALFVCCQRQVGQVPLPCQSLGAGFTGCVRELPQVGRVIDIECDAGKRQNYTWFLSSASCRQMWFETVVSETQREQSCRTPPGSVRATSVSGRNEYRALFGRGLQNLFELGSTNQGNVAWNDQRAVYTLRLAETGCHFDSIGLAAICVVRDDLKLEPSRQSERKRIAGDDADVGTICPRAQGLQHIEEHGLRQFGSSRLIQNRCQPLLGVGKALDGDKNHDGSAARALSALNKARTVRASLVLSSTVRIMVLVQWTRNSGRSNLLAASRSRTSAIRMSRKSSYALATPAMDTGIPCAAIKAPAGPDTAASPTIGLTAATVARVCRNASRMSATARIGPMLVTGLLGARITALADIMESTTPGAGSASVAPAKRTDLTGS